MQCEGGTGQQMFSFCSCEFGMVAVSVRKLCKSYSTCVCVQGTYLRTVLGRGKCGT